MSLGIKSFATEGVGTKHFSGKSDGFLDSSWVPGFTMDSWVYDVFLDSRWVLGFTIYLQIKPLADLRIFLILTSVSNGKIERTRGVFDLRSKVNSQPP